MVQLFFFYINMSKYFKFALNFFLIHDHRELKQMNVEYVEIHQNVGSDIQKLVVTKVAATLFGHLYE